MYCEEKRFICLFFEEYGVFLVVIYNWVKGVKLVELEDGIEVMFKEFK